MFSQQRQREFFGTEGDCEIGAFVSCADKPDLCGRSMIRFVGEKRWIVERTFTGITTNRRLATDFELFSAIVQALIQFAILGKTSPSWSDSVSARGGSFSRRGR